MTEKLVGRRKRLPHEKPMCGRRFRLPTLTIQRLHDHWWASKAHVTPLKTLVAHALLRTKLAESITAFTGV
jgi:hypothetical protein